MKRCVLITGASGGIGGAIASAFAANGDVLVLGSHSNPQRAKALCAGIEAKGGHALVAQADIRTEDGVEAMFAAAEAAFGPVTVLVNNAGIAASGLLQDTTTALWDDMMDTHAKAAFLCSKRALPAMLRQKNGCILNVASIWGEVGASCEVAYSAAKAALIGFTKALAKEVAPSGVRVNCLSPGVIETPMLYGYTAQDMAAMREDIPLGRLGSPEDIAASAVFLASDNAAYITGQVLGINGGMVV